MRSNSRIVLSIFDILYFVGAVVSVIVCVLKSPECYASFVFLPMCFFVCLLLIVTFEKKRQMTVNVALFCAFLRYVILPLFQSINPVYSFARYNCTNSIVVNKAVLLMCYELFIVSIFFVVYNRINTRGVDCCVDLNMENFKRMNRFPMCDNKQGIIIVFCILSMCICFLHPSFFNQISFIFIKSDTGVRVGQVSSSAGTIDNILRQFFIISIFSLFIVIATSLRNKHYDLRPKMAVNLSLLVSLCCVCVIISEQRSSQVYCAFASIILMVQLFPEYKKKIIKVIIVGMAIVLVMLTIYKTFYAFKYESYWEAISRSSLNLNNLIQTMEIYLLGPITISSAIEFGATCGDVSLLQLLYDICRSSIGLSFLMKGQNAVLTSSSYNMYVTGGRYTSGFLLPITGQGYLTFGFIFSPVLICCCYYLALKLEKIMLNSNSTYVVYFSGYVFIRLATCMVASNLNTVLNSITSIMISAGVVYIIQLIVIKISKSRMCYIDEQSEGLF